MKTLYKIKENGLLWNILSKINKRIFIKLPFYRQSEWTGKIWLSRNKYKELRERNNLPLFFNPNSKGKKDSYFYPYLMIELYWWGKSISLVWKHPKCDGFS